MADNSDIVLEEDTVRIHSNSSGESPVVDIEGGNLWNLDESDGDLRIGDPEYMLKMGVSLGGGGAGNGRLRATSDLRLGGGGESVVSINDGGIYPHNGTYSLGSHQNRWDSLWLDGDVSVIDGEVSLDADSTLKSEGNVLLSGQVGLSAEILGDVIPVSTYDLGSSSQRWGTQYVDNVSESSDRRLKTDIEELDGGLETLLDLRPVSYSLKGNGSETHLGLIGQEVADVLPEIVNRPEDDDGYLGLNYTELVAVFIDAIQTQHDEQERLEDRVDRQRDQIEDQQERIDDLEKRLAALEDAT